MPRHNDGKIYSATYSNVPVYEYGVEGNHIMRRRSDDWINATHILKVADYDKPARTRILEREVQKGVHEKVQGGYGKYQGTWIPLEDGRLLAERNGVLEKLRPIFDFVPGDRSPPPAPKHATAASAKPRAPRATNAAPQRRPAAFVPMPEADHFLDSSMHDGGDETPDNMTIESGSGFLNAPDDEYDPSRYTGRSNKRRRMDDGLTAADREHQLWADELLDYFMLQDSPMDAIPAPPSPPANANLNRPIDEKGHTALHWAAAMGDVEVCKDLIRRGASVDVQSKAGETPLMRAVFFTNSFDKQNMERLALLLIRTVNLQTWNSGATVFHHIANTTARKSKYQCARYYTDCILNKMAEVFSPDQVARVLDLQDANGDTAITIAARNGARKCVRSLIGRNAQVDIPNALGETADQLIVALNARRQERSIRRERELSSSPFQGDSSGLLGSVGAVNQSRGGMNGTSMPFNASGPHASLTNGTFGGNGTSGSDIYKSEAALTLTAQIMPTLFSKAKELASSLDQEMGEKDAELAEAEKIAAARQAEIATLKHRAEELRVTELEQTSGGVENDAALAAELEKLEREFEGITEAEQLVYLRKLVEEQEAIHTVPEPSAEEQEAIRVRDQLASQLRQVQSERIALVKEIASALGEAGLGENVGLYKRLITGALGVREEDVDGLLPDIVGELEESRGMTGVVDVGA